MALMVASLRRQSMFDVLFYGLNNHDCIVHYEPDSKDESEER